MSDKAQDKIPADIRKMSFEDALDELEDIVRTLEEGSGALDEAISAYERGAALKKHCEKKLQEAKTRVEKVVIGPGGEASSEPVDIN